MYIVKNIFIIFLSLLFSVGTIASMHVNLPYGVGFLVKVFELNSQIDTQIVKNPPKKEKISIEPKLKESIDYDLNKLFKESPDKTKLCNIVYCFLNQDKALNLEEINKITQFLLKNEQQLFARYWNNYEGCRGSYGLREPLLVIQKMEEISKRKKQTLINLIFSDEDLDLFSKIYIGEKVKDDPLDKYLNFDGTMEKADEILKDLKKDLIKSDELLTYPEEAYIIPEDKEIGTSPQSCTGTDSETVL